MTRTRALGRLRELEAEGLRHGLQVAVRNNASAYAYSVLITATFGMLTVGLGPPGRVEILVFAVGATSAFAVVEAAVSDLFRDRIRPERSDVILLGSALSVASVTLSLLIVLGIAAITTGWLPWFLGPLVGTGVYLAVAGVEMALARARQEEEPEGSSS